MPIEIIRLLVFDGPNFAGPRPGVLLGVRSDRDIAGKLRAALKDGGQSAGLVLGYLEVDSAPAGRGQHIAASFATPTPALGAELARYVVAGLNAVEAGDDTWDPDEPLWQLQRRRRDEALPIQALQLMAEADSRGIPSFVVDGRLQLGHGAHGMAIALTTLRDASRGDRLDPDEIGVGAPFARAPEAPGIAWDQLGGVPLVAVAGGTGRLQATEQLAAVLRQGDTHLDSMDRAGLDATRALLSRAGMTSAVIGLDPDDLAQRGTAFARCSASALVSLPDELPHGIADREELARALGVPLLLTEPYGRAALNADVPEIASLAEYVPCAVALFSASSASPALWAHLERGGAGVFLRDGAIVAARREDERVIAPAPADPAEQLGALAAWALLARD